VCTRLHWYVAFGVPYVFGSCLVRTLAAIGSSGLVVKVIMCAWFALRSSLVVTFGLPNMLSGVLGVALRPR